MKANERTAIVHPDVVLVPYRKEHVAKYHEWMTSEELRELTASEPLTLEEEYDMQRKWQEDEDKLTFILLLGTPEPFTSDAPPQQGDVGLPEVATNRLEALPMIGDVNLFFNGARDNGGEDDDFEVEVEIMIAEPAYRRRGIAHTALQLMLSYATDPASPSPLPVARERLVARIGEKNGASIRLFEKLGFSVTKRVAVFEEVELRFSDASKVWTKGSVRVLDG
ncbi:GNAT domain-containing protein [Ganoderma leucocontextum]|nr:GNAT domain-containing protein [Ganoderma leucocontextum]